MKPIFVPTISLQFKKSRQLSGSVYQQVPKGLKLCFEI